MLSNARLDRHRRGAIGVITLLIVLLTPAVVHAHADLDTITPADKSSGPAPAQIVGTFEQNLDPKKSSFTVVDAGGAVVASGGEVTTSEPRTMTLTLPALVAGTYTVRWTTLSTEDNEIARGTTTFTVVAEPSQPPSTAPSESPAAAASASTAPSVGPSISPSVTPSGPPATPAASTTDAIIPIVALLAVLVLLGLWLLRGRSRTAR